MLIDSYQRRFSYLRLSLLPVCNFRCLYCLPNGNPKEVLHKKHLTRDEIRRLVAALTGMGIKKIRLTGGEPTLRPDLLEIARAISEISEVEKIALTTNGYKLVELAGGLKLNGVNAINISVDSLKPERFFEITGQNLYFDVLKGIEASRRAGIEAIKINAVVLNGVNDCEIEDFIHWAERESLNIRFIELMPTADNGDFFKSRHLSLAFIETLLEERGWSLEKREESAGPADVWSRPGSMGKIGLIRPYSSNFCNTCNRLRVTSEGDLQLCLFGKGNIPLRPLLQDDAQKDELEHFVRSALGQKNFSHFLHEGDYGSTRNFATMGG
ncbi:MAG: GTP 3',8-cyclase MoaA [Deltaproteobacteria bacterium]|nr:GTP 3',8-cyclase MoaA [Deltaproteobacteria bacterium]